MGGVQALSFLALLSLDGILGDTVLIDAIQAFTFADITNRLADPTITSIAELLAADATTLANYTIHAGVTAAPRNVLDSDRDGAYNSEDAFPFDPTETTQSSLKLYKFFGELSKLEMISILENTNIHNYIENVEADIPEIINYIPNIFILNLRCGDLN